MADWTTDSIRGEELYDQISELDENHYNLADEPNYQVIKKTLFLKLRDRYEK